MRKSTAQILMFHRVKDDSPTAWGLPSCYRLRGTALTPAELRSVLAALPGPVLSLAEIEGALNENRPPPKGFVLTFDDGYVEHGGLVADILEDLGHEATFFVSSSLHADGGELSSVDAWYWLLDHSTRRSFTLDIGTEILQADFSTIEGKLEWVVGAPKRRLLESTPNEQARLLYQLADACGLTLAASLSSETYMAKAAWSHLIQRGHRLGAHGRQHVRLAGLDDEALALEVAESLLAVPAPAPFSYPDGDHDDRVVSVVRRKGASSAVTCVPGDVTSSTDPFRLPRRFVHPGWTP